MNDSNVLRDGREELGIMKYVHYVLSAIVLFEGELRLIKSIYGKA